MDYRKIKLSALQWGLWIFIGFLGGTALGVFFTRMIPISLLIGLGIGGAAPFLWREHSRRKQEKQLRHEFREMLRLMLPLLRSGRSLEGMIDGLCEDLDPLESPLMNREMQRIRLGIRNHQNVEDLFVDLGERSDLDELRDFAQILKISKRTRGDLTQVLQNTAQVLEEKMEAEEELRVVLSGRKMEQRLMNDAPFLVIGMLMLLSPDYLNGLYTTFQGKLVMMISLGLIGTSLYLSERLTRIEI